MIIKIKPAQLIMTELELKYGAGNVRFNGVHGCYECGSCENVKYLDFDVATEFSEEFNDFRYDLHKRYAEPEGYECHIWHVKELRGAE